MSLDANWINQERQFSMFVSKPDAGHGRDF